MQLSLTGGLVTDWPRGVNFDSLLVKEGPERPHRHLTCTGAPRKPLGLLT